MVATNRTIGFWTPEAKEIKKDLIHFIQNENPELIEQDAAIPHAAHRTTHPRWWECCTALELTNPRNCDVLDVGGLNNVIGWYLAMKHGCNVYQIGISPIDEDRFEQNRTNPKYANVPVCGEKIDVEEFARTHDTLYDVVFCISVFEHVDFEKTASSEQAFLDATTKLVKPGGLLCLTFDYNNHGHWKKQPRASYLKDKNDIMTRIVEPSKMNLVGDLDFDTVYPSDDCCERGMRKASTGIVLLRKDK